MLVRREGIEPWSSVAGVTARRFKTLGPATGGELEFIEDIRVRSDSSWKRPIRATGGWLWLLGLSRTRSVASLAALQAVLGHGAIAVTERYGTIGDDLVEREALRREF